MSEELGVTIEDLLKTSDRWELDEQLQLADDACGYGTHLNVAWAHWHYGRHAEFAEELGMDEMSRLFSAAWQISLRVHEAASAEEAADAREEIRATYQEAVAAKSPRP